MITTKRNNVLKTSRVITPESNCSTKLKSEGEWCKNNNSKTSSAKKPSGFKRKQRQTSWKQRGTRFNLSKELFKERRNDYKPLKTNHFTDKAMARDLTGVVCLTNRIWAKKQRVKTLRNKPTSHLELCLQRMHVHQRWAKFNRTR